MAEEKIITPEIPKRWDVPYADELPSAEMSYEQVRELLHGPLKQLTKERKRFPGDLDLPGILRNDTRIRSFRKGEIIVREGEYGNSAFLILRGKVNVVMSQLPAKSGGGKLGTSTEKFFRSAAKLFQKSFKYPENRRKVSAPEAETGRRQIVHLEDFSEFLVENSDSELDPERVKTLTSEGSHAGEFFGEFAAFSRMPRTASVLAAEDETELLEIRWQGLRDIRKYSQGWKEMMDSRYRTSSLNTHLSNAEYLRNLEGCGNVVSDLGVKSDEVPELSYIANHSQFRSFGENSWKASFKELAEAGLTDLGASEPVIVKQGSIVGELIVIRNGFVRVTRRYNHGEKTVAYLGKGQTYGMLELYHNAGLQAEEFGEEHLTSQHSLSAVGYVDILVVPSPIIQEVVVPKLTAEETRKFDAEIELIKKDGELEADSDGKIMEFLLHERVINGTAAMFIDLDRCTQCDDCVRACATTHDNNPRFIRAGKAEEGIQFTHACMHCVDPVCMIGCPTGAIHRDATGNQVVINESTCIGCSTCADNCPYDNIQMVELRDQGGDLMPGTRVDPVEGRVRLSPLEDSLRKATKCDLCETLVTGPACVNACPHDAMIRADMTRPDDLINFMKRQ